MKNLTIFIIIALSLNIAFADCPVDSMDSEKVDKLISSETHCIQAIHIAEQCRMGSNLDVYRASLAEIVCSQDIAEMKPADKQNYHDLRKRCFDKYANEQGTLYRSISAFCALSVTQLYYEILSPVDL